ncbi:shikimate kinase [Haloplanus vescus]|uniref:Shikimate kinase n=1 Tax=Haloplanus vescus TaxID=555874 RepID=A0A1H3WJC5_9EURY|nr:shikimate kinase [Haloplanus vescus]SDZ86911.1 shikimate kinase [Haloplanus vescus]
MHGEAVALGAGTVLNALATGVGSAFAIDAETTARVELDDSGRVDGEIAGAPDGDTRLIRRCVERVVDRFGDGQGGHVRTESDVPMAAGLKSSSAAANATVLATLSALDVPVGEDADIDREDACRIGVAAARDAGVTVTGAFDDASASMLGGVTVTDNTADDLLAHETVGWDALVWTPPERAFSADADVERCEQVAPMADLVADLALDGRYGEAMTVNGLAFSAALGFPTDPAVEAMPHVDGVSLSGTGPSVVAVGDRDGLQRVRDQWEQREGDTWLTTTRTDGAWVIE